MSHLNSDQFNPEGGRSGRVISILGASLAFLYFGYLACLPAVTSRWLDFPVYWEAGRKAVAGLTVYDVVGHFQYKYSPLVALGFGKFFQTASFEQASFVFQKGMLALWAILFLGFARRDYRRLLLLILFFGNALRLDLELGQINALVLYLLVVLFGMLDRPARWSEDLPFGVLFSFAVQLKLFSLVLIPLLILRREWRKLALGILALPAFSLGGVAIAHGFGFALAENRRWLASLGESTDGLLQSEQNVGALGTFLRLTGPDVGKALWFAAGVAFLIFLGRNRERANAWFRDWLLYAVAIFNPLVWSYWILFALPLCASRLPDFEGALRRRSISTRVVGALAGLFVFFAFNGQHARWAWGGGIFLALLLVAGATFRVRSRA